MVEIAICLAVIGFALVAIIGVLPAGMEVQRQNREETIINQDASVFINAIRNGAQGLDDLTNYVFAITNYVGSYGPQSNLLTKFTLGYTWFGSSANPPVYLTNGLSIVGLLSTPRYVGDPATGGFFSNYVVAFVRSLSGPASEKFPQTNQAVQDLALNYRLVADIVPFNNYDPSWTNYLDQSLYVNPTNLVEIATRSNYWMFIRSFQTNFWDMRLTFRWPLRPDGSAGNGRQSFRAMLGGSITNININGASNLYLFQPRLYVKGP